MVGGGAVLQRLEGEKNEEEEEEEEGAALLKGTVKLQLLFPRKPCARASRRGRERRRINCNVTPRGQQRSAMYLSTCCDVTSTLCLVRCGRDSLDPD